MLFSVLESCFPAPGDCAAIIFAQMRSGNFYKGVNGPDQGHIKFVGLGNRWHARDEVRKKLSGFWGFCPIAGQPCRLFICWRWAAWRATRRPESR